jgi:hypothetical protein
MGRGFVHCRSVYEGAFKDGYRHGKGKIQFVSGNYYEGDWVNNKKEGTGTMNWVHNKEKVDWG